MKWLSRIFRHKEVEKPEKEVDAVDYEARKTAMFNQAPGTEPLDDFEYNSTVAYYYWMHYRLHGFYMAYDDSRRWYETGKHVLEETEEYAKRLPRKDPNK